MDFSSNRQIPNGIKYILIASSRDFHRNEVMGDGILPLRRKENGQPGRRMVEMGQRPIRGGSPADDRFQEA
jgi:hypothetical protein